MTPEEAQRLAEEKWERLVEGEGSRGAPCGWCNFAKLECSDCPVWVVLGHGCEDAGVMRQHSCNPTRENAQAVLDHLRAHGELFIKTAKEMIDASSTGS